MNLEKQIHNQLLQNQKSKNNIISRKDQGRFFDLLSDNFSPVKFFQQNYDNNIFNLALKINKSLDQKFSPLLDKIQEFITGSDESIHKDTKKHKIRDRNL